MIYLIGSLRNSEVPKIGIKLREAGFDVFDDWYAAGPEADDKWKEYEQARGRDYLQALKGEAARNVFQFDKRHLDEADSVILVLPAGKSGHLELGYVAGCGKRTYILLDNPDRWDVMYQFADLVTDNLDEIIYAESLQQASQELPAGSGIRGATDKVGQPLPARPDKEGEGSGGSLVSLSPLYHRGQCCNGTVPCRCQEAFEGQRSSLLV